jgi:lipoprotein-anchoring transpeptidase ErfK/SrfK
MERLKQTKLVLLIASVAILLSLGLFSLSTISTTQKAVNAAKTEQKYWLLLQRRSNQEFLYKGVPGDEKQSKLLRTFIVKPGVPGEKPTPLPELIGRQYWLITKKMDTSENPETAPYFLELDVPVGDTEPFGPQPYLECDGQCNWVLPGAFGLHGVNGDGTRLSSENTGSSGCVRHTDSDITYLYNLLDPQKEPVRYYIQDI